MLKKAIAAGLLSGMMIVSGVCGFAADAPAFTDVKDSDWFATDVGYVCENGLMKGVSETRFDPQGTFTRGMLVTVLHRMEGEPSAPASSFADVEADAWYADAVGWAAQQGIVNGTSDTTFSPMAPITREQLATIIYRYVQMEKQKAGLPADVARGAAELRDELSGYCSDGGDVSEYALQPALWAVQNGILNGDNRKLMPRGDATRAQVAAVISRFYKKESYVPAEDGAFYSRDGKTLYRIPEDMKGIFTVKDGTEELSGRCAFRCAELEAVVIPEGVKTVGQEAFAECPKLKSVSLPASLESLGEGALPGMIFKGSDQLEILTVAEGNPRFHSEDNVIFDDESHQLVLAVKRISGTYTVPEGVTWFGTGAFAGCSELKELILADSVKSVNSGSFIGCDSLEAIHFGRDFYLPDPEPTVTAVGIARYYPVFGEEFRYCPMLKHITVSEENPHFIAHDDCLIDVDRGDLLLVPQGKTGVLTLPEGIGKVGKFAFYQCSGLTEIRFPEGMKSISSLNSYEGCAGVEKVYLPVGIEYIYDSLEHMPNLKTIEFGGTRDQWAEVLEYYYNRQTVEKLSGVEMLFLGD